MAKPNGTNHEQQGTQSVFPSRQSAVAIESTQQKEIIAAVTRETEFVILPDGRMVDLIRSIHQPSKIEFLVWQDGNIWVTSHIEHDGELLVVPKMDPTGGVRPAPAHDGETLPGDWGAVHAVDEPYRDVCRPRNRIQLPGRRFRSYDLVCRSALSGPVLVNMWSAGKRKNHATAVIALFLPPRVTRVLYHTGVTLPVSSPGASNLAHR